MHIFDTQDILFNIAFPYAALNVSVPHIASRDFFSFFVRGKSYLSGIYLYFRKSQAGQMEL